MVSILPACGGGEEGSDSSARGASDPVTVRQTQEDNSLLRPEAPPEGLQATIDVDGQSVDGRFNRLRFKARLTGEGQATASFERVAGMTLVSTITGPRQGTLEWRGTTLDGVGSLTLEELEATAHFADRIKAEVLALIPLDLACRPGADELDPAIGAALLLPWQILLKYQPEGEIPTPPQAATRSQCQYALSPLEAIDPKRTPSPSVVGLSTEQPVPMAIGYFPFDREGIKEPAAITNESNG